MTDFLLPFRDGGHFPFLDEEKITDWINGEQLFVKRSGVDSGLAPDSPDGQRFRQLHQPINNSAADTTHMPCLGYRLHYGTNSRSYAFVTNASLARTQTVVLPHTGRWFFAATARDANGMESEFSNEVEWEAKPAPPVLRGEPWVRLSPVIERSTNQVDWVSAAGVPTFIAATNGTEFFITRRLVIENVQRVIEP